MGSRSAAGGISGVRIAMAALLTVGLCAATTAGVVIDASPPAAAATCPTLVPEGPEGWPTPVPAPTAGVDWSGCDLRGAYIISATLTGADLRAADLRGAQLWGTDLSGADLGDADLGGAALGGRCDNGAFSIGGADLDGADLTDANLTSADLGGEFSYAGTQQCIEYGAQLDESTITGADLAGAGLLGVTSADLTGQPTSLPVHWLLDGGAFHGPGATCARVRGKATIEFKGCQWTILNPFTSTPSASGRGSALTAGGNLTWKIAHPQTGRARQTSVIGPSSLSSPGQGVCPSGSTEQDVSGILGSGFESGDSVTAQLCQQTKAGSFELAPGTTAGL